MSLFICSRCGCIENTNLINKTYKPTIYQFNGDEKDFHPNLFRMDMDGFGKEDIYLNGKIWKHSNDILYLCSECNTGTWHDEFEKTMPSESTVILSQFSKAGYITTYDHDACSIIKDNDNIECGYKPNMQYYYLLKLYRKLINDDSFKGNIIEDLNKRSVLLNSRQAGNLKKRLDLLNSIQSGKKESTINNNKIGRGYIIPEIIIDECAFLNVVKVLYKVRKGSKYKTIRRNKYVMKS